MTGDEMIKNLQRAVNSATYSVRKMSGAVITDKDLQGLIDVLNALRKAESERAIIKPIVGAEILDSLKILLGQDNDKR